MELLKQLCAIHAPAGNEIALKEFIIQYVQQNQHTWTVQPELIHGPDFQDCLMLKFGKPRTAIFAHMDSIGFTVRYQNQLVKIGGPVLDAGIQLVGTDEHGPIHGILKTDEETREIWVETNRELERGTELVFAPNWREDDTYVQCCYMDNRLGVYNALKVAETLTDGLLVFSCWEEHGGGSVGYLTRYMYEQLGIRQALISDITWVTEGVQPGLGAAISLRDRGIPRKRFVQNIVSELRKTPIPFQIEVEGAGGSDGGYIQESPYPVDWCFIGAPEQYVHSPNEKVHKADIASMIAIYQHLMRVL